MIGDSHALDRLFIHGCLPYRLVNDVFMLEYV